tara:strand:+ start:739 stop:1080 length:342 start_codon:yes stop_codon:yes gene_type:complete
MKSSIREELSEYITERATDTYLHNTDETDFHNRLFNEDYYIIGYYQAEQWLEGHGLSVFDAISICNDYEQNHLGEIQTTFDNAEKLVNNLVFWYGLDLVNELYELLKMNEKWA